MEFNLRSVDLNLLPIFEAAYEERGLSRAAQRLAMTQPAMSHALTRLRHVFRDDLFVRLYALDCVDLAALHAQVRDRLVMHRARLALYERIETKKFSGRIKDLRRTGLKLGLQIGLTLERANVAWCELALETLAAHLPAASRPRKQKAQV